MWNVGNALNFPACGPYCTKDGPGGATHRQFYKDTIYKFMGIDDTKLKCFVYKSDDATKEYQYYEMDTAAFAGDSFIELDSCADEEDSNNSINWAV